MGVVGVVAAAVVLYNVGLGRAPPICQHRSAPAAWARKSFVKLRRKLPCLRFTGL